MNDPVTLYSGDPTDMLSCATIRRVLEWHEAFDERITGNERREIALHQLRLDDVRDLGQWVLNGLRQYGAAWAQREEQCHPKLEMRKKCSVHGENSFTSGSSQHQKMRPLPDAGGIANSADESSSQCASDFVTSGATSSAEMDPASPSPPMTTKPEPPLDGDPLTEAPSPDDDDDLPF